MNPIRWLYAVGTVSLVYVGVLVADAFEQGPSIPPTLSIVVLIALASACGVLACWTIVTWLKTHVDRQLEAAMADRRDAVSSVDRRLDALGKQIEGFFTRPQPPAAELDTYAKGYADGLARQPMANVVPMHGRS